MNDYDLGRVWQRRFGWVRVRMTPQGLRHEGDDPQLWALMELLGVVLSLAGLVLCGAGAAGQIATGNYAAGAVLAIAALVTGWYALKRAFDALIDNVAFLAIILAGLFLLPFPSGRRAMRRWWGGEPRYERHSSTAFGEIAAIQRDWFFGTRFTIHRHGRPALRWRATGAKAERLGETLGRLPVRHY